MPAPELSGFGTGCLRTHVAAQRNASQHTILAYRDAMKLLLRFAAEWHKRPLVSLGVGDLSAAVVLGFLDSLETRRHHSVPTRNVRLAAIHCFFRYVLACYPAQATLCQRVLAIPLKKRSALAWDISGPRSCSACWSKSSGARALVGGTICCWPCFMTRADASRNCWT